MLRILVLMAVSGLLSACASLNSVSVSSVPAKRDNMVSATAEKTIFLAFNFDNDYVNAMSRELAAKCPGGKVSGVLTKDETILYFLFIVYKKKVTATGYCESKAAVASAEPRKAGRRMNSVEKSAPAEAADADGLQQ
ncbi:MAG: hypothetical protein KF799_09975 [Bdellovibrionales bacterium]|nr:hypothetical protein [Bdellovibrionales bacterium]